MAYLSKFTESFPSLILSERFSTFIFLPVLWLVAPAEFYRNLPPVVVLVFLAVVWFGDWQIEGEVSARPVPAPGFVSRVRQF